MFRLNSLQPLLAAVALCFISNHAAALDSNADPAVYGALPSVSYAEISPDGETVAQIQSIGGARAIAFYDLTGQRRRTRRCRYG